MGLNLVVPLNLHIISAVVLVLFVAYTIPLAIYRLRISPIAHFPGPKLAALTFWYEFYHDVLNRGHYTFHVAHLHALYGPIIRINPCELHVATPAFYSTLYATSAKRDKWAWYTKQFGTPESTFSTVRHELHRMRRAALGQSFSMAMVRRLQPVVEERVRRLVERLRDCVTEDDGGGGGDGDGDGGKGERGRGTVVRLEHAFAAFTNDVVMEYSLGRSDHRLEREDFGYDFHDAVLEASKAGHLLKQMIWILHLAQSLPSWLAAALSPSLALVIRTQSAIEQQILQIKSQTPPANEKDSAHPNIFLGILQSDLPESEKSVRRLRDEAVIVAGAGTLTTSWALTVATYHVLASPRIISKLKAELREAITDPSTSVPLQILERLPYLTSIIQEALRLSYGVSSRLQRVCPDKTLLFTDPRSGREWPIPPGTPVSMTSTLIHHDESIFPDSQSFIPERWIANPHLQHYLVSFSKGSRQCIGINLAYAEMYLCLAAVFRHFGSVDVRGEASEGILDLEETTLGDVEIVADGFVPLTKVGSKGVRVKVRR